MENNLLIESENLIGLEFLLQEKKMKGLIDLVYIDPPFATNADFTVTNGRASTISSCKGGQVAYSDKIVGANFVAYIKERLWLIKELMSDRGSIYLHTDYKIGHYLKVMMDEVFGIENFRGDITRVKCNPKNFQRIGYGNVKDMILFYTKTNNPIWHEPFEDFNEEDIIKLYPKIDTKGRRYTTVPIHAPGETSNSKPFKGIMPPPGRHWRTSVEELEKLDNEGLIEWSKNGNPRRIVYADEKTGKRRQDVWVEFKDPLYPKYPTEKNASLLDVIITTSSDINSIVLDCFCGSGTTLYSAKKNGRKFIGIDKSKLAIEATMQKLQFHENSIFSDIDYLQL